ncbi:hypothetical protein R3P38DRAFT_2982815 [Favolaschia claudopus]|uniref:Uncharacterized protein n=1 Tax=Favolaschia claudopus TaxID=2862362 RepID=A0AAW0B006_9AGAR
MFLAPASKSFKPRFLNHPIPSVLSRCFSTVDPVTDLPDVRTAKKKQRTDSQRHMLGTLNSELLLSSDYLDLSGRKRTVVAFPKSRPKIREKAPLIYSWGDRGTCIPFPPKTQGFLYYLRQPDAAPLEAAVRFRVTGSRLASSFNNGEDLLYANGCPWQVILPQIACRHVRIRDQLVDEELVSEDQLARCRALFGSRGKIFSDLTMYRLSQEFPVNFQQAILLTVVGETNLHYLRLTRTFGSKDTFPWLGTGIARFEPSTDPLYRGRRVLHLRIVKIVDPVKSNVADQHDYHLCEPQEGQLLATVRGREPPQPWAYDIDNNSASVAVGLRMLWENSRLPIP